MALTDDVAAALAALQTAVNEALAQKDVQIDDLTAQLAATDSWVIAQIVAMTAKLGPL